MLNPLSRKLALVTAFAAAAVAVGCKKEAKKEPSGDSAPPPVNPGGGSGGGGKGASSGPPAGWCEARDVIGGYRVFLPGDKAAAPDFSKAGGKEHLPTGCYAGIRNPNINAEVRTFSLLPPAGVKLGTTPDELFAGLQSFIRNIDQFHDVLEKAPVTLGVKPALKIVLKKKPSNRPKMNIGDDSFMAKMEAETAEREQKEQAKRQVFYVTNTGTRIIIVEVNTPGEPDPAILKTVTDSFAFL